MGSRPTSPPPYHHPLDLSLKHTHRHVPKALFRAVRYVLLVAISFGLLFSITLIDPISSAQQSGTEGPSELPRIIPQAINHTEPASSINYRIGKVTASFGHPDPIYELAISSHNEHNTQHGYLHFVLRSQVVRGLWSKHAYLLTILGLELSKPASERLDWLFWHDRDTIVMNPHIPLDAFLPPEPEFAHINLLVTKDRNGLNNGVFFVRVSEWGLKMFASALSIREYMPDLQLKYTEQSGMEEVIKRTWWKSSVAYVPQTWFNGFPPSPKSTSSPSAARPGSLLIHFASNRDGKRPDRMVHWAKVAHDKATDWYKPFTETRYAVEIAEYWERTRKGESMEDICEDIRKGTWT